ncbi:MAG: vWA domain-containing protein [Verrucomicrobiota bacterium]
MVEHLAELVAGAVILVILAAESLHALRLKKVQRLAFGPGERPAWWVAMTPLLRALAGGAVAWGMVTLLVIPPKAYKAELVRAEDIHHVVLVYDVSPSMKLQDAGPDGRQARRNRVYELMESFFKRFPVAQMRLSLVAFYTEAKPVVVDTKDVDVVRNFLDGMDMHTAFDGGQTKMIAGLEEAAKLAEDWRGDSTTIVALTDGDTVPPSGMPRMPRSVRDVLIVGVGDPNTGTFIDGRNSRQDAATLRQVAARLGGTYHDGNQKHLPSALIASLTDAEDENPFEKLTKREYALLAIGLGGLSLSAIPLFLAFFGTSWRPGVPKSRSSATGFAENPA